jgi:TIR domain
VFPSYDDEHAARAEPIAAALEGNHYSVWRDRHIRGGAEYNSEIETVVERSDAVVVLWSEKSAIETTLTES